MNFGLANMVIIGGDKEHPEKNSMVNNLYYFNYKMHDYSSTFGVYDLLDISEAYNKLQKNDGFLYKLEKVGSNNLSGDIVIPTINELKVKLSETKIIYIESDTVSSELPWTNYLQPFYIFSGTTTSNDGGNYNFSFIIPALKDSQYKSL